MTADISLNYIFLYDSRCNIFSDVSSLLGWMIEFLNIVPQSSWQRLSPGQVLFWVQLRLNIWQHWELHRSTANKQLYKGRQVCPWCIKEQWGGLLAAQTCRRQLRPSDSDLQDAESDLLSSGDQWCTASVQTYALYFCPSEKPFLTPEAAAPWC